VLVLPNDIQSIQHRITSRQSTS